MCGRTGNGSFADFPVRWIIRKNQAGVTGVPASVTNIYGLLPCRGRKARSSSPCNGWTLSRPPLALLTCSGHAGDRPVTSASYRVHLPSAHVDKPEARCADPVMCFVNGRGCIQDWIVHNPINKVVNYGSNRIDATKTLIKRRLVSRGTHCCPPPFIKPASLWLGVGVSSRAPLAGLAGPLLRIRRSGSPHQRTCGQPQAQTCALSLTS